MARGAGLGHLRRAGVRTSQHDGVAGQRDDHRGLRDSPGHRVEGAQRHLYDVRLRGRDGDGLQRLPLEPGGHRGGVCDQRAVAGIDACLDHALDARAAPVALHLVGVVLAGHLFHEPPDAARGGAGPASRRARAGREAGARRVLRQHSNLHAGRHRDAGGVRRREGHRGLRVQPRLCEVVCDHRPRVDRRDGRAAHPHGRQAGERVRASLRHGHRLRAGRGLLPVYAAGGHDHPADAMGLPAHHRGLQARADARPIREGQPHLGTRSFLRPDTDLRGGFDRGDESSPALHRPHPAGRHLLPAHRAGGESLARGNLSLLRLLLPAQADDELRRIPTGRARHDLRLRLPAHRHHPLPVFPTRGRAARARLAGGVDDGVPVPLADADLPTEPAAGPAEPGVEQGVLHRLLRADLHAGGLRPRDDRSGGGGELRGVPPMAAHRQLAGWRGRLVCARHQ